MNPDVAADAPVGRSLFHAAGSPAGARGF